MKALEWCNLLL